MLLSDLALIQVRQYARAAHISAGVGFSVQDFAAHIVASKQLLITEPAVLVLIIDRQDRPITTLCHAFRAQIISTNLIARASPHRTQLQLLSH